MLMRRFPYWLKSIDFLNMKGKVKLLGRVWLFVTPWTVARQAPLSMGILQARILDWVAISFSRRSSWSRDQTWVCLHLYPLSHQGSPSKVFWLGVLMRRFPYWLKSTDFLNISHMFSLCASYKQKLFGMEEGMSCFTATLISELIP